VKNWDLKVASPLQEALFKMHMYYLYGVISLSRNLPLLLLKKKKERKTGTETVEQKSLATRIQSGTIGSPSAVFPSTTPHSQS